VLIRPFSRSYITVKRRRPVRSFRELEGDSHEGLLLADLCRSSRTASDHSQPDRGPADLLKTRAKLNEGFRMIRFFLAITLGLMVGCSSSSSAI
jgi:hypothetical protein